MLARIVRRTTVVATAGGGVTAAVWIDAVPAVALLVGVVVLFAAWVISDKERTDHVVAVIKAVKGTSESAPATASAEAPVSSSTAGRGRWWRASTR